MITGKQVMEFLKQRSMKPLGFKEIALQMGLPPPARRTLRRVLRELVASGEVVRTRKGLYGPSGEMELVTGYFEAHRDGFGFVVQEKPGQRDLFIPPRASLSAMDGDRVVARVEERARRQGRIIRVLERAHRRVAGTFEVSGRLGYVKPRLRSITFDVHVPPGERGGARRGQRVIVEITGYPAHRRPSTGRVVRVLERPEDPGAEVEAVIEEFGLPRRFPAEARNEARLLSGKNPGRRRNLRGMNTVTIDGEKARDFDDAISIRLGERGYTLWVHIADVGFYVAGGSALDSEARGRGTSVYFPDRVIPMLPRELSEDLCSLRPGEDRPAITVEMDFDRGGSRLGARFYPSLIRSNERMTYTSVRKILTDWDEKERARHGGLLEDLELAGELAGILRHRRLKRGSLDFDLPEPEILLDVTGMPEAVLRAERNFAHMLIEEFMIAANEAVAEHLRAEGVPALYRIHEEPDPEKLEELLKLAGPYMGRGGRPKPAMLYRVLEAVKGKPVEEVITYMVLRSLKQARYSHENAGHFGLASGCYTHFTSPIRRYPDLVVHRILRELVLKGRLPDSRLRALEAELPDIAFHSSRRERVADDAERDVVNVMRMWFMKDKVGAEFRGTVAMVTPRGLRVRLEDFYVEGLLHVSCLTDDYYVFDETAMALRGRHTGKTYGLGHKLNVRVDRVDMEEREIVLGI
jgi:ribonuclease R